MHFFRALAIALRMPVDEDRLRTHLGRRAQRHGRMHSKLPRRIGSRRDDSALVPLSSDHDCLAFQGWIEQFFDGDEERVHVDVENSAGESGLLGGSHRATILAAALALFRSANSGVLKPAPLLESA